MECSAPLQSSALLKIGVTGTREGASPAQKAYISLILHSFKGNVELHHGDCVGVDEQCHDLMLLKGHRSVIHPPIDERLRSTKTKDYKEMKERKSYLDRNKDIVDASNIMLIIPKGPEEQRSGTWSTYRYARSKGKPIILVEPSGVIKFHQFGAIFFLLMSQL